MIRKHHTFTRNGVTYECHAHKVARPLGSAAIYEWFVQANEKKAHCFRFTGSEFDTTFTTQQFEDEIVVCVVASELPETETIDADAILKAEALTPGRFILHRDGRSGVVQGLDVTRRFAAFEYDEGSSRTSEWVSIDDLIVRGYRAGSSDIE